MKTPEQTARELAEKIADMMDGRNYGPQADYERQAEENVSAILTHIQPLYSTIADNDIAYKGLTQTLAFSEKELELSESRIERLKRLLKRAKPIMLIKTFCFDEDCAKDQLCNDCTKINNLLTAITAELQKKD